ncbi:hypothetical protein SMD22_00600 (plasmid) [Brevibacillus halotolerans]|nr:hypothetical protein SMD22_00600 [Brevibacillus halotolerans]
MKIDAAVVLISKYESGLRPKERVTLLSHFNEEEELASIDAIGLETTQHAGALGYATTSLIDMIDFDTDRFIYFLERLLKSNLYSPNHSLYRFQGMNVLILQRENLETWQKEEAIVDFVESKTNPNVESLAYHKLLDGFAIDFLGQYYQDFLLTITENNELTINDYLNEIDFRNRLEEYFDSNDREIAISLGYKGDYHDMISRSVTVEVKQRFLKDAKEHVLKKLKQRCVDDNLTDLFK